MQIKNSFLDTIGDTPLIYLKHASEQTNCTILGKAEFMNPSGSIKDRAALGIIKDALARKKIQEGTIIVEGSAGNTGISLALAGRSIGCRVVIVIPKTQAKEKKDAIRMAGAELVEVEAVPYKDKENYIHVSERLAEKFALENPQGAFWANQFDNVANSNCHYNTTAPEIWEQTQGKIDGFICSIGSGGTFGGISKYLKNKNQNIKIGLADPPGSGMKTLFETGKANPSGSSITEGIGQGRITGNLNGATPDICFEISDSETLKTTYDLVAKEGLSLGMTSGINVAGAMKLAREMGKGHTIVTVLCDSASRYISKIGNKDFLMSKNLPVPTWI